MAPTQKSPPAPGPTSYSGFRKIQIPASAPRPLAMFTREGKFAFASPSVALWANPSNDRVGWLNLEDGEFKELFACKRADCVVAVGDVAVATFEGVMVVFDKARNKKVIRIKAQPKKMDIPALAITPDSILSVQALATDKRQIQIWSRNTNTHQTTLPPAEVGLTALASTGAVATKVIDSSVFQFWSAPYQKPTTLDIESNDEVVHLAYSSSGNQLAVLLADEVVWIDAASKQIIKRFAAPPPAGKKIKTPLRRERLSRSWVYPTDQGQIIIVDFARDLGLQEVTMELWDGKAGKRVAFEIATLKVDKDRSIAEEIAISEFGVLLNRDLLYRLQPR